MTGTVISVVLARLADLAGLPLSSVHRARVEAVRDEAGGMRTLVLRPGRWWQAHRPGQHVQIGIAIGGRIATRTYSISSAPDRRRVEITVKAQGRASTYLSRETMPGTFVTISPPAGDFVLPDAPRKLLFVTAGSGITPIASMVRSMAASMPDAVHVHFARSEADVAFGEELRTLSLHEPRYVLIVESRRLGVELLDGTVPDWREREAFACGPASMLEAATACMPGVHVERFRPALARVAANSNDTRHRVRARGLDVLADGATPILQVAEANGVSPAHGCRMGICHTCDQTLVSGCVRDLRTGATIDEPGARVQICVCAAASDVEVSS